MGPDSAMKTVVVGDGAIGKTCLLDALTGSGQIDWDDPHYEPRAATNHSVTWDDDDGEELEVELWNTTGQACLAALRAISYPETDVFLLAYDMTNACSLENLADWLDEIQEVCDD